MNLFLFSFVIFCTTIFFYCSLNLLPVERAWTTEPTPLQLPFYLSFRPSIFCSSISIDLFFLLKTKHGESAGGAIKRARSNEQSELRTCEPVSAVTPTSWEGRRRDKTSKEQRAKRVANLRALHPAPQAPSRKERRRRAARLVRMYKIRV